MSINSRYRKERPYAAHVIEMQDAMVRFSVENPNADPNDALPGTQFAIAFAILDLSDAIREHAKEARR